MKKNIFYILTLLFLTIAVIFTCKNFNYLVTKKFINSVEKNVPNAWISGIKKRCISIDYSNRVFTLLYFTDDFNLNSNSNEIVLKSYDILKDMKYAVQSFLTQHPDYYLNQEYVIEIWIFKLSGENMLYLTNQDPIKYIGSKDSNNTLMLPKGMGKSPTYFPYLFAFNIKLSTILPLADIELLSTASLEIDNIDDFRQFSNLRYLSYGELINHTDIPDEDIKNEIQKLLPDCVIQDSGDTIVKE